jgi:hypothetical protein
VFQFDVWHFYQVMNAFLFGNLSSPTVVLQQHLFPQDVWYIQISSQPNFRLAYFVFLVFEYDGHHFYQPMNAFGSGNLSSPAVMLQ